MQYPVPHALSRLDNSEVLMGALTRTNVPLRNYLRSAQGLERRRTRADVVGFNLYTIK